MCRRFITGDNGVSTDPEYDQRVEDTYEALELALEERYRGWSGPLGQGILTGELSLETLSKKVLAHQ